MKTAKQIILLFSALALFTKPNLAQSKSDGIVTFKITYLETKQDTGKAFFKPSKCVASFRGDESSFEMSSTNGRQRLIIDNKSGECESAIFSSGNSVTAEPKSKQSLLEQRNWEVKSVTITNERKTIAGYNCKKVNCVLNLKSSKKEITCSVWVTTSLAYTNSPEHYIEGVKGFMMEFDVNSAELKSHWLVTKVELVRPSDAAFKRSLVPAEKIRIDLMTEPRDRQ